MNTRIQYFPKLKACTVHVHSTFIYLFFDSYSNFFLPVWLYIFFLLYSRVKCPQWIHPLSKRSRLCYTPLLASLLQSQYLYWLPDVFLVILLLFSWQFLNCFPLFSITESRFWMILIFWIKTFMVQCSDDERDNFHCDKLPTFQFLILNHF